MPQQAFALRWGYADSTSIKVVGHSLSSSDIIITVSNGSTLTLSSMSGLGADSGTAKTEAFFVDSGTVTGLSGFTTYTYTATQDGNSISGSFTTAPSATDDFVFFAGTCDGIGTINSSTTASGMYTHIKAYAQRNGSLPVVGLLHPDDHYGYMDNNGLDDSAGTGHQITSGNTEANESAKVYDYALGAGGALGLYSESGNFECTAGHDADRVWCMQNIPVWPQKGDHDAGHNEMSWLYSKTDATTTLLNPAPQTMYNNAKVVWDAILAPLQPPSIDGANSNAWGFALGPMYICAPDAITTGSGDAADGSVAPTTIYGNTQIDSVLAAVNNNSEFKVLALANGIRYLNATATDFSDGSQNPLSLHAAEYARLFTATSGLMGLNATNGVFGTFFTLHGDYHSLKVQKNENTSGVENEWFYSFNLGTLTGSANFEAFAAGTAYDGSTVIFSDGPDHSGAPIENNYWCARVEVYGSKYPKEARVVLMDKNGDDIYSTKFVAGRGGNDAFSINKDLTLGHAIEVGNE